MSTQKLAELIQKFLEPVRGKDAQGALCREMTKALQIGSDSVSGFPTIIRVRAVITERLCTRLINESGVKSGDVVTYHIRRIHRTHKGANMYGWEPEGRRCRVVSVSDRTLSLSDGHLTLNSTLPLYCVELLAKVGATVDFADLDARAKAIAEATKKL